MIRNHIAEANHCFTWMETYKMYGTNYTVSYFTKITHKDFMWIELLRGSVKVIIITRQLTGGILPLL